MNPKQKWTKKNEPKKKWRTQTTKLTKAPSAVLRSNNTTSSLSDLWISCSSVTNGNHHEICAPPRGWGWVGEWMRVTVRMRCEWESVRGGWDVSECERERESLSQWGWGEKGGWVESEMREMSFRVRVDIYIYIEVGFFVIFNLSNQVGSGTGSGRVFTKTWTQPGPVSGFFSKTQTQPYSLSGRVKSDPLGSGRAGYPWVGYKLPSLQLNCLYILHGKNYKTGNL